MKKLCTLFLLLPNLAFASGIYNPGSSSVGATITTGASNLQVTVSGVEITSPTGSVNLYGGDFAALKVGVTAQITLNPATTDFIHNQTTAQTATFNVSSGTVSTQLNTTQLKFTALNCVVMAKDGTCLLSMPDVNSMFIGYNSDLVNTGGLFNYASGPNAMPYPGGGNFNACVGPYCMSGSVITVAENNNGMGYGSCGSLRGGFYNNCMGGSSGLNLRDGSANTNVGGYSGQNNVDNSGNTNVGTEAGRYQHGSDNVTALGYRACNGTDTVNANITGTGLTCLGKDTGQDIVSASPLNYSFAVGDGALYHATGEGQLGGRLGSGREVLVRMASATVETASFNVRNVSYLWPGSQASGTKVLSNDGSGNLTWATDASGYAMEPATVTVNLAKGASISTITLTGQLVTNGSAGVLGQTLVSMGPNAAPAFVDPIVSQATDALLNASVSIKGSSNTVVANQGTLAYNIVSTNTLAVQVLISTLQVQVNGTVPVSGTFFQTTQPISGTVSVSTGGITAVVVSTIQVNVNGTVPVSLASTINAQVVTSTLQVQVSGIVPISGTVTVSTGGVTSLEQVLTNAGTPTTVGYQLGASSVPVQVQNIVSVAGTIIDQTGASAVAVQDTYMRRLTEMNVIQETANGMNMLFASESENSQRMGYEIR